MLLTLKSNKYKPGLVHVMLALSLQICLTKNSTLEPVMAIYVNPFGGSHSESWFMPVSEGNFPDWGKVHLQKRNKNSSGCIQTKETKLLLNCREGGGGRLRGWGRGVGGLQASALRARSWKEWGAPEAGLSPRAPPADGGRDPVSLFSLSPDFSLSVSPSLPWSQSHPVCPYPPWLPPFPLCL